MTEAQIQAYLPSVATLLVVGIGILFNNSRISDVQARISDLRSDLHQRWDETNRRIDDTGRRLDENNRRLEELQSVFVGKLTEVEIRLARIEASLGPH